jgi:hypothetical protein
MEVGQGPNKGCSAKGKKSNEKATYTCKQLDPCFQ